MTFVNIDNNILLLEKEKSSEGSGEEFSDEEMSDQ
jgi:hypothetical protein